MTTILSNRITKIKQLPVKSTVIVLTSLFLTACASGPSDNISLVTPEINAQSSKRGVFTQKIEIDKEKPGCSGECPVLKINSLVFPGHNKLTLLVDHALASMTWLDIERPAPYTSLAGFENYFWQTAAKRDEFNINARTRYRNKFLTVVELNVGQYRTGMAHGIHGSDFINWDNQAKKELNLKDILVPGGLNAFNAKLELAYNNWLANSDAIQDSPENFARMWPFSPSDNMAITDAGIVIKYQPYEIAPYSFGQPEFLVPYSELKGILLDKYMPS